MSNGFFARVSKQSVAGGWAYIMASMFSQSGCSDWPFNIAVNQTAGGLDSLLHQPRYTTGTSIRQPPLHPHCNTGNIAHICQEFFTPSASSLLPPNYSLRSLSPLVSAAHQCHTHKPVSATERTFMNGLRKLTVIIHVHLLIYSNGSQTFSF